MKFRYFSIFRKVLISWLLVGQETSVDAQNLDIFS